MFLLKNTKPEDFFKNGLPRDFAGLDLRTLDRKIIDYRPYNAMIISEHFSKKDVLSICKRASQSLKYTRCLQEGSDYPWQLKLFSAKVNPSMTA